MTPKYIIQIIDAQHCSMHAAGGGATQIIMPYLTTAIAHNVPEFEAWRWAFFVPGAAHVIIAFLVMVAATVRPSQAS